LPNHYATLGLHRLCTTGQIRDAYRALAKKLHPDVNPDSAQALARTQELNAAYELLSDPGQRRAYDQSLAAAEPQPANHRPRKPQPNISQDVLLRLEEFFRGTALEVRVHDPANAGTVETYPLEVPPATAPGARFRIRRDGKIGGGHVLVRVRLRPDFRFKARGSDLQCDLRISSQRATQGGQEMVNGPTGNRLRVHIPRGADRGEILRIDGEGLPKPRGGRGDLLVRITYRVEVRITRALGR
jgi:curved DNA-binding protein